MLKDLKSLFIVEDKKQEKPADKLRQKVVKKAVPNTSPKEKRKVVTNIPKKENNIGKVNSKIVEKLLTKVSENNIDGFDYFEFKKSLKTMSQLTTDEAMLYKSAFSGALAMGTTLPKIIESLDFYLSIIVAENKKFMNETTAVQNSKIENKVKEKVIIKSQILEKEEQIKKITLEIEALKGTSSKLETFISGAKSNMEKTQKDFSQSYNYLKNEFLSDKEKMKKYLK